MSIRAMKFTPGHYAEYPDRYQFRKNPPHPKPTVDTVTPQVNIHSVDLLVLIMIPSGVGTAILLIFNQFHVGKYVH